MDGVSTKLELYEWIQVIEESERGRERERDTLGRINKLQIMSLCNNNIIWLQALKFKCYPNYM